MSVVDMKIRLHWSSRRHKFLRAARDILLVVGCGALGICAFAYLRAFDFQHYEQWRLDRTRSSGGPGSGNPTPGKRAKSLRLSVVDGAPFGKIEIPRLGMSVVIVEGVTPGDLRLAVGHIPGTAFPDESGNVAIAGHRDTFFRPLMKIRSGDIIILTTSHGAVEYLTAWTRVVRPTDVGVLKNSADS